MHINFILFIFIFSLLITYDLHKFTHNLWFTMVTRYGQLTFYFVISVSDCTNNSQLLQVVLSLGYPNSCYLKSNRSAVFDAKLHMLFILFALCPFEVIITLSWLVYHLLYEICILWTLIVSRHRIFLLSVRIFRCLREQYRLFSESALKSFK